MHGERKNFLVEYPLELVAIPGDVGDAGGVVISVVDEITQPGDTVRQFKIRTLIRAEFIRGDTWSIAGLDDLSGMQGFLDNLDAGRPASWKAGAKGTLISVNLEETRLPGVQEPWIEPWLTIRDESVPVRVSLRIETTDEWFELAYRKLDEVMDRFGL
jgi:hypothetical protein